MIVAYVGANGEGKTLGMVRDLVLTSWAQGRPVVSSMPLFPERLGYSADLYLPLLSFEMIPRLGRHFTTACPTHGTPAQLTSAQVLALIYDLDPEADGLGLASALPKPCGCAAMTTVPLRTSDGRLWSITGNRGCTLLLDEITALMPSRGAVDMPPELQRMTNQLRKPDVWLGWSAPDWARADLMLREVTMTVVRARSILGRFTGKRVAGSAWRQNRVFRWDRYDAREFDEANDRGMLPHIRPLGAPKVLWRPAERKRIQSAYDTFAGVQLMDHIACGECGGKLARKVCKCHDKRPVLRTVREVSA